MRAANVVRSGMTLIPVERSGRARPSRLWPMWGALTGTIVLGLGAAAAANWVLWRFVGRPKLDMWDTQTQQDVTAVSLIVMAALSCVAAVVIGYRRQRIAEVANTHM